MHNKAFQALVESINAQIQVLNNNGYQIYDADNPDYFISGIRYDNRDDEIKFETKEDIKQAV